MEAGGDDMAVDPRDLQAEPEGQGEGPEDTEGHGLVLQPEQVGEGEPPEFVSLIELVSQYVNYNPLLNSMRDRKNKLAQEQLYVKDLDLQASIQEQLLRTEREITKFEERGDKVVKALRGMKITWSGGEVSFLDALLKAEGIRQEAENLAQLSEAMRTNKMLGKAAKEVGDLIQVESKRKEKELLELTTVLIGAQVRASDYAEVQLLWQPAEIGTKVRLDWDLVTQRWTMPPTVKPIKAFREFVDQISELHAPNACDGDTLDVEGRPIGDGTKWAFKATLKTSAQWGNITCSNSTSTQF